jgi:hypothetical protein
MLVEMSLHDNDLLLSYRNDSPMSAVFCVTHFFLVMNKCVFCCLDEFLTQRIWSDDFDSVAEAE